MIVYVDIDDTICETPYVGWTREYSLSVPLKNRIHKINKMYDEGHTIVYWTARGSTTQKNWFELTLGQLEKWGCKYHELRMGKPAYDLFIDDKNINSEDFFNVVPRNNS